MRKNQKPDSPSWRMLSIVVERACASSKEMPKLVLNEQPVGTIWEVI